MEHLQNDAEETKPVTLETYGRFIFQTLGIGLTALPSLLFYKESPEAQQLLRVQERNSRERRGKAN